MLILKAEGLRKEWNGKRIFENGNIEIHRGERVSLIGRNGVGKTTFLGCLLNRFSPDGGRIYRGLPVTEWGIIEQHIIVPEHLTVKEFVLSGHSVLHHLKKELTRLENLMESEEEETVNSILEQYSSALEKYQAFGGYEWEYEVKAILNRFYLTEDDLYIELSGGQKTRAQLARVLSGNPSFLLMDEPTNHLDIETMDWLISWIQAFNGTILFVSHDREFIDQVANKTVELTPKGTKTYHGGYSDFLHHRNREQREQESLYKKQQQERKKLEEAIIRYREWFAKAHAMAGERNPFLKKKAEKNRTRFKAKEKALERLDKKQVERPSNPGINVQFKEKIFEARYLVRVENMGFSYGDKQIFKNVNLTVSRGDRLAVIGPNGSGKTTLLKLLSGKLTPMTGSVYHHPQLKIGYFAQELDNLNKEETILDSLLRQPGMTHHEARNILACFFFRGDAVFQKIGTLSMGERCRLAFVNLYFSDANLMVLDEPTNYLDIPTREQIESALNSYPGAMVLVSHDRYLLKRVSNRVAALNGEKQIEYYPGTYREYESNLRKQTNCSNDREVENRKLSLQLKLAQLMSEEEPEDENDKEAYYKSIKIIKEELNRLQTSNT